MGYWLGMGDRKILFLGLPELTRGVLLQDHCRTQPVREYPSELVQGLSTSFIYRSFSSGSRVST